MHMHMHEVTRLFLTFYVALAVSKLQRKYSCTRVSALVTIGFGGSDCMSRYPFFKAAQLIVGLPIGGIVGRGVRVLNLFSRSQKDRNPRREGALWQGPSK